MLVINRAISRLSELQEGKCAREKRDEFDGYTCCKTRH